MDVAEIYVPHSMAEGLGETEREAVSARLHSYFVLLAACQLDLGGRGSVLWADPSPHLGTRICDSYSANRHTLHTLRARFLFMNG